MTAPGQIDVSGSLKGQVSVKPDEHDDERTARLRAEQRGALIDDCKGIAVFVAILLSILAIGALTRWEGFFDVSASADTRRWSQTILSALMTGGLGFVLGRKAGK